MEGVGRKGCIRQPVINNCVFKKLFIIDHECFDGLPKYLEIILFVHLWKDVDSV